MAERQQQKQQQGKDRRTHHLTRESQNSSEPASDGEEIYRVELKRTSTSPHMVDVTLDGASLKMEVDKGTAVYLISKSTYNKLWEVPPKLTSTTTRLCTYSGQQ